MDGPLDRSEPTIADLPAIDNNQDLLERICGRSRVEFVQRILTRQIEEAQVEVDNIVRRTAISREALEDTETALKEAKEFHDIAKRAMNDLGGGERKDVQGGKATTSLQRARQLHAIQTQQRYSESLEELRVAEERYKEAKGALETAQQAGLYATFHLQMARQYFKEYSYLHSTFTIEVNYGDQPPNVFSISAITSLSDFIDLESMRKATPQYEIQVLYRSKSINLAEDTPRSLDMVVGQTNRLTLKKSIPLIPDTSQFSLVKKSAPLPEINQNTVDAPNANSLRGQNGSSTSQPEVQIVTKPSDSHAGQPLSRKRDPNLRLPDPKPVPALPTPTFQAPGQSSNSSARQVRHPYSSRQVDKQSSEEDIFVILDELNLA